MERGQQGYPLGQIFETQYYGQCNACKEPISPNDRVFYATQETLVHAVCPKFETEEDRLKIPLDGATKPVPPTPEEPVDF